MMSLIGQIKQVYFEVDLDDMTQIFGSMNKIKMPKDIVLKNLLTDAEYERVAAYFDKKGKLPFAVIENYKPMLLSAMVQEQAMPCNNVKGMEMLILLETAKRKLDANGLETMSFQTDLFDSIPYKEQAEDLVKTIDSLHSQQTQIDTLIQLYRKQNLTELGKLISESGGAEEKYMNLLVYDRNKKWVSN